MFIDFPEASCSWVGKLHFPLSPGWFYNEFNCLTASDPPSQVCFRENARVCRYMMIYDICRLQTLTFTTSLDSLGNLMLISLMSPRNISLGILQLPFFLPRFPAVFDTGRPLCAQRVAQICDPCCASPGAVISGVFWGLG